MKKNSVVSFRRGGEAADLEGGPSTFAREAARLSSNANDDRLEGSAETATTKLRPAADTASGPDPQKGLSVPIWCPFGPFVLRNWSISTGLLAPKIRRRQASRADLPFARGSAREGQHGRFC
jgi:hypothetical protein